jgi:uncharacterized membrane protein HdeD (DUF308 family)
MIALIHAWWVAMMRGIAALTIALVVLLQPQSHVSMSLVTTALGAYILVDSVIALSGVIVLGLGVCGMLLLTESLVGLIVATASLSEAPHTALHTIHAAQAPLIVWAFMIGIAEAYTGIRIGRERPAFQRNPLYNNWTAWSPGRASLLAGVVAVTFALALLALPMTSAGIAVPVIGLFAAALGYLRIGGGLTLGALRLERIYSPS